MVALLKPYFLPPSNTHIGQLSEADLNDWNSPILDDTAWAKAPIIIVIDFRKLGNAEDSKRPAFFGQTYLGDLDSISEMGLCICDTRNLFKRGPGIEHKSDPKTFQHEQAPGPSCRNWLTRKNFRFKHYINLDDLAIPQPSQIDQTQSFSFAMSMYRRARVLPEVFDQFVATFHLFGKDMRIDSGGTVSRQRHICFVAHGADTAVSVIDSYKIPKFDHRNPATTVRFFDVQDTSLWNKHTNGNDRIDAEALAHLLGVHHPLINAKNAGNSAALTMMGLFRFIMATADEVKASSRGHRLARLDRFPCDLPYCTENNVKACAKERENAIKLAPFWSREDNESKQVALGLLKTQDRSVIRQWGHFFQNVDDKNLTDSPQVVPSSQSGGTVRGNTVDRDNNNDANEGRAVAINDKRRLRHDWEFNSG